MKAIIMTLVFSTLAFVSTTATASGKAYVNVAGQTNCKIWDYPPSKGEYYTWSGACKNGFANGKGKVVKYSGKKISETAEGSLKKGKWNDYASMQWHKPNEHIAISGQFKNSQLIGSGKINWKIGNDQLFISSNFKNGKLTGATQIKVSVGKDRLHFSGTFKKSVASGNLTVTQNGKTQAIKLPIKKKINRNPNYSQQVDLAILQLQHTNEMMRSVESWRQSLWQVQ